MFIFIQDGPEKNAQTLVRHHFATVSNSVTWFSPKCSELTGNTNERQILNVMILMTCIQFWLFLKKYLNHRHKFCID